MGTNKYALILPLSFAAATAMAQSYGELDINDVRARFWSTGLIAGDTTPWDHSFEISEGGGMRTLQAGGLWISGYDGLDSLHVAALTYGGDSSDYFPGPLTLDGTASTTTDVSAQFDHVWSADRIDIDMHLAYFSCLNDPGCDLLVEFPGGYTIPTYFYEWPAINANAGYSPYLAPFYDLDMDGAYNPDAGDAPCIFGDRSLFLVFNDKLASHALSGGLPFGVEVRSMPFAYTNGAAALEQTVFIRYQIINRSGETYNACRIGFFNEIDLGCNGGDYVGCDVSRNLAYHYNADDFDEGCPQYPDGGDRPSAFGQVILKGPLLDANGSDDPFGTELPSWNGIGFGDSTVDNERSGMTSFLQYSREGPSLITDPVLPAHFRNYMSAIWKNGAPVTYGGNGYGSNPDPLAALFMYPGSSDPFGVGIDGPPQSPWQETSFLDTDRRNIPAMGPFTLDPGEHVDLLIAYVHARSSSGGAMASITALQQRVDSIRAFAATLPIWNTSDGDGFNGQCADYAILSVEEEPPPGALNLFPVPANEAVRFQAPPSLVGANLLLCDALGRTVLTQRVTTGLNQIDIASLANGVYTFVATSSKARYTGRLIKE